MTTFWSWWLGSLALGGLTLGFWILLHRPLGVSGSWARLVGWRETRAVSRSEAAMRRNPSAMGDALLAATIAEFGAEKTYQMLGKAGGAPTAAPVRRMALSSRVPWTSHLIFLVAMAAGGFLAVFSAGQFQVHWDLGAVHAAIFGQGWRAWLVLLAGGMLVGFGTQMAGGCTSGHGLSGCSRFVPASLVATAVFFGMAVLVSVLLKGYIR